MLLLKRIFFAILAFIFLMIQPAQAESGKILSAEYDNSSSVLYVNAENTVTKENFPVKFIRLENPNRIYFDINDSVLTGPKQQFVFDKSEIKELRLAQFSTNPNTVRVVITFEENFDTSNIKLINSNGNVMIKIKNLPLKNEYFNPVYDENQTGIDYSGISVSSQVVQKMANPANYQIQDSPASVIDDINRAFADSTLNNSDGKTYDSVVSIDVSSNLKLRTKYFINEYCYKNGGLLVSGLGQMTVAKIFTLDSPKRIVIDLPNSYLEKRIRNKEVNLCPNGGCKDTAKIGQFEHNKTRIVVTTDKPDKYIPVYSYDSQSMLFINSEILDHTSLAGNVANLNKAYTKRINSQTNELILSFTSPVVHSIIRENDSLALYIFNVKSYNEPDIIKTLKNSPYKNFTLSLLPQVGIKANMKLHKDDKIQIFQGVDGKAIRIVLTTKNEIKNYVKEDELQEQPEIKKKPPIKNKVVLDPGHGGTDYGAIREGINEKDITLDITKRVGAILKSKGYKIAYTRKDDTYVSLEERVDFSEEENPEIFVSIHVNSAVATEPSGIETHYYHDYSKELANIIQNHMIKDINSKNRGVLKSKFYVINHTTVPAVLVETGFLSNAQERAELITEKRKQQTAQSIADGIIEYLKSKK